MDPAGSWGGSIPVIRSPTEQVSWGFAALIVTRAEPRLPEMLVPAYDRP
jgi:hypothetical protein